MQRFPGKNQALFDLLLVLSCLQIMQTFSFVQLILKPISPVFIKINILCGISIGDYSNLAGLIIIKYTDICYSLW